MSFTQDLLTEHAGPWEAMTRHEFILSVADGTIEPAQFHAWLAQDYLYVEHLIGYLGLLLARAPQPLQRPLGQAVVVLSDELELFRAEAQRLGVELAVEPQPACFHYQQFLTAVGYSRPFLPALTVLWALERAYLDAWLVARAGLPVHEAPYRSFVEQWTKPEFAAWVEWLAQQVDALAAQADPGELAQARELFVATVRYEWLFWQMALDPPGWPVCTH